MSRDLQEILESGELTGLALQENIRFIGASDESFDGEFMRIGQNGFISLYRVPNQDAEYEDNDIVDRELTTTPTEYLSVTPLLDITTEDGSYSVSGSLANTANQDRTVYIQVNVDGIAYGSEAVIQVPENDTGKLFSLAGVVNTTIAANAVVTVEFSCSSNGDVVLQGSETPTYIKLIKQGGNPV